MTGAGVDIELTLKYGRCISEFAQPLEVSKLLFDFSKVQLLKYIVYWILKH